MNRYRKVLAGLIAAASLSVFVGTAKADPPAGAPASLKIAVVAFLSGPASGPFGIPARNAADVWIEKINREGGIGGVKVIPVFTDEAGPADKVVTEFRRLALEEKVAAVVGYISSANCLAVAPVADAPNALTVSADCGAARYLLAMKPDVKTIAGINQDYAWGRDSWEIFQRSMRQLKPGVQVVDVLWPKIFAGDYSTEISKLLVEKPDVVFTSFWGSDLVTFSRQAKARGLVEQSIVLVNNTGSDIKDIPATVLIGSRGPGPIAPPD